MAKWQIDTAHAFAEFKVKHMGIAWVTGHMFGVTGDIDYDPENPSQAKFNGKLDATTITTGNEMRDGHLKSDDFLDVDKHQFIEFKSTSVKLDGENDSKVKGELTIRGVTKEVELWVTFEGTIQKPNQEGGMDTVAAFMLTTTIDRKDFGLDWNMELPGGNWMVGDNVDIRVDVEAIQQ